MLVVLKLELSSNIKHYYFVFAISYLGFYLGCLHFFFARIIFAQIISSCVTL